MEAETHLPAWKTLSAFAIIYFVWGSTFLAIRGVREVPPFLLAAMRFSIAGLGMSHARFSVQILRFDPLLYRYAHGIGVEPASPTLGNRRR
jgi:hypothetical protein